MFQRTTRKTYRGMQLTENLRNGLILDQMLARRLRFGRVMSRTFYRDGFCITGIVIDRDVPPVCGSRPRLRPRLVARKPIHRLLEIAKGAHVPSFDPADEGEQPRALITFRGVQNRQTEIAREADLDKGIDQGGQLVRRELGAGIAAIEQGAIHPALFAGFGESVKRGAAGYQVELALGPEADEFRRANDFKLNRHLFFNLGRGI